MAEQGRGLLERLDDGPVICAEGYLFELERRGYLQAGAFVPEVVLEHPELVAQLHREFVHAGSDVVEAFTYYAHREKLRLIGREDALEQINRQALSIAAEVALIALDAIREAGLPAVITLAIHRAPETREGWTPEDACRRIEDAGAAVVGLNCIRGPQTMLPLLERIRAACDGPVAALPVPYRTTDAEPSFQSLTDPGCDCIPGDRPFPTALDPFTCNRYELGEFARAAAELGVGYLGVCCGAAPHHIRAVAEALGRTPPASRYSADMSRHAFPGSETSLKDVNRSYAGD